MFGALLPERIDEMAGRVVGVTPRGNETPRMGICMPSRGGPPMGTAKDIAAHDNTVSPRNFFMTESSL